MPIESRNPATGVLIKRYDEHTPSEIDSRLNRSARAFASWKETTFEKRAALLMRAGAILRERKRSLAETITTEMGKVIKESVAEVEKCAANCDFYANNAEKILSAREVPTDAFESRVRYDPIGPVLAIMPWNFPFWQLFRFAAPALMAGNVAVLKHASNVPGCAIAIESVFSEAGFDEGVFTNLLIPSGVAESVIRDSRIAAVTLTGSCEAGMKVASVAGSVLKKTVLELGGSDPFIVLEDADLEKAASVGVVARFMNCGQVCIAAKRFIVVKKVGGAFTELFETEISKIVCGNPLDEATGMGPMARMDLRETLQRQVTETLSAGAKLVLGGGIPEGTGAFYPPTLMIGVRRGMVAVEEELFGPVAPVMVVDDEREAVEVANSSRFGLGASVWTGDLDRARRTAAKLESGAVFFNGMTKSDPRLPFGGVKGSGYGRELSEEGIREFCNIKTVWMAR